MATTDSLVEEEIFLLTNYKNKSAYIKVCFKYNDEYHFIMVQEAISAATGLVDPDNCIYYWEDAPIADHDLVPLIKSKKNCGHFKIVVRTKREPITVKEEPPAEFQVIENEPLYDSDNATGSGFEDQPDKESAVMSVEGFKEYFLEFSKDPIHGVRMMDDPTEPSARKKIILCAVRYLFQECGIYPSIHQKKTMTKIILKTFKGFTSDLVDKWMLEKIKNYRKKAKKMNESYPLNMSDLDLKRKAGNSCLETGMSSQESHLTKQVEFLKNCIKVEVDDIPRIESALDETLKFRIDESASPDFSVLNTYKFFSQNLSLVLYDFDIRFPSVPVNLMEKFETFLDASCTVYRNEAHPTLPEEDCLMGIRRMLTICHFTKTPVHSRVPSFTIQQMLDAFMTFSTTDEDKKPELKDHPVILAEGSSKKAIWKYSIQIGESILELPQQTKFMGAFDYLLRAYYVFNIEFPKSISVFMNFIMTNLYEINIKSKYDQKKTKIEDLYTRPREFLRKVKIVLDDMK